MSPLLAPIVAALPVGVPAAGGADPIEQCTTALRAAGLPVRIAAVLGVDEYRLYIPIHGYTDARGLAAILRDNGYCVLSEEGPATSPAVYRALVPRLAETDIATLLVYVGTHGAVEPARLLHERPRWVLLFPDADMADLENIEEHALVFETDLLRPLAAGRPETVVFLIDACRKHASRSGLDDPSVFLHDPPGVFTFYPALLREGAPERPEPATIEVQGVPMPFFGFMSWEFAQGMTPSGAPGADLDGDGAVSVAEAYLAARKAAKDGGAPQEPVPGWSSGAAAARSFLTGATGARSEASPGAAYNVVPRSSVAVGARERSSGWEVDRREVTPGLARRIHLDSRGRWTPWVVRPGELHHWYTASLATRARTAVLAGVTWTGPWGGLGAEVEPLVQPLGVQLSVGRSWAQQGWLRADLSANLQAGLPPGDAPSWRADLRLGVAATDWSLTPSGAASLGLGVTAGPGLLARHPVLTDGAVATQVGLYGLGGATARLEYDAAVVRLTAGAMIGAVDGAPEAGPVLELSAGVRP